MRTLSLIAVALFWACRVTADTGVPSGYRVNHLIALDPERDGASGAVRILEDIRIAPEIEEHNVMLLCMDSEGEHQSLCDDFHAVGREPKPPIVQLLGSAGSVLDQRILDREHATLRMERIVPDRPRILLAGNDQSIGMGSYAGTITWPAEIRAGRFIWLQALDPSRADTAPIGLASTALKTAWRLLRAEEKGFPGILQWACRPTDRVGASGALEFEQIFRRFSWDGSRWVTSERRTPGFRELEDPDEFPDGVEFPQALP